MNLAKLSKFIWIFVLLAIVTGLIILIYLGKHKFVSLISGQPCKIKKATFSDTGAYITLMDVDSLDYISTQLVKGNKAFPSTSGFSSHGVLCFGEFIKMEVSYSMSYDADHLLVGYEESLGFYDYFIIPITNDTPHKLVELVNNFVAKRKETRKQSKKLIEVENQGALESD